MSSSHKIPHQVGIFTRISELLTAAGLVGVNRETDRELYCKLIDTLFATPKSIITASIAGILVIAVAWIASSDPMYGIFMGGFGLVAVGRVIAGRVYAVTDPLKDHPESAEFWEAVALVGACCFAALNGLIGAYTITYYAFQPVEILILTCVMGYIAGVSSRNAGRPIISIGQISATCIPVLIAMVAAGDLVHIAVALFIGALFLSTIVMARTMHENIVARHVAHRELEVAALTDSLTGVGSRMALMRELDRFLAEANPRDSNPVILMAIDLDKFKDINDTLGHPTGDAVLKQTALRIQESITFPHMIARIGGDEFLVLVRDVDEEIVVSAADDIINRMSAPFLIGAAKVSCGASVGLASAPRDASTSEELLQCADMALYEAKGAGRGQAMRFAPALASEYLRRVDLERRLEPALQNGEFALQFQPIVNPKNGSVVSCEALLRWHSPERGFISPLEFIPLAEATGQIVPIGAWVLREACREAAKWPDNIKVAVNTSLAQFRDEEALLKTIETALEESGIAPERLILEVTESMLIEDIERMQGIVRKVREMNIGVSLDDFGTGFSSLAYLSDFPFSQIKFDKKFSQDIGHSPRTKMIVETVTGLCQKLGMTIVAEGVETQQQLLLLHAIGINAIQGFIYSRPLSVDKLVPVISAPVELSKPDELVRFESRKRA